MLGKHFALFGSTGVGKSSGVAVILREVLETRPNLRIFLIDPHNEYGHSLRRPGAGLTRRTSGCRSGCSISRKSSTSSSAAARAWRRRSKSSPRSSRRPRTLFANARNGEAPQLRKLDPATTGYTVDTPVPYRLSDLVSLIDERMGKLENRSIDDQISAG